MHQVEGIVDFSSWQTFIFLGAQNIFGKKSRGEGRICKGFELSQILPGSTFIRGAGMSAPLRQMALPFANTHKPW